ncbi:MAG: DUF1353 domain-containing protein [Pseudomonadota bacterium]
MLARRSLLLPALASPLFPWCEASAQFDVGEFTPDSVLLRKAPAQPGEFVVEETVSYRDPNKVIWEVPEGTLVNGASIPQYLWSLVGGPFTGDYVYASVIHDHFCVTKERTSNATHRAFYYAMLAEGLPLWRAQMMYLAVEWFGDDWEVVLYEYGAIGGDPQNNPPPRRVVVDIGQVPEAAAARALDDFKFFAGEIERRQGELINNSTYADGGDGYSASPHAATLERLQMIAKRRRAAIDQSNDDEEPENAFDGR